MPIIPIIVIVLKILMSSYEFQLVSMGVNESKETPSLIRSHWLEVAYQ